MGAGVAGGMVAVAQPSRPGVVRSILLPVGSALVSLVLYSLYGGWEFGLGLILLLFVHEMGHFVVIRAKGLPASLPIFIPFLGAFVAMRRMPKTVRDEAEIAIAGPLAGALAGGVCFALYLGVGGREGHILLYLAYFSFLINLLNLAPISPLDGGRIAGAISRWFFPLGLVLLAVAFVYTWNLLLLLLGWLWLMQAIARFRAPRQLPYYAIGLGSRIYISLLYLALAGVLTLAFYVTQNLLSGSLLPFM